MTVAPTAPVCVLIADDDEDIRVLVSVVLTKAGYGTAAVGGGRAVLAAAAGASPPRLYVLDVRMPDVDGLEVCRRLKADPATATAPVMLVSAESSPADIEAAHAAGCDAYLQKPFSTRELVNRVAELLERSQDPAA